MDAMPKLDRPPRRFMQATGLVVDDVTSSHVTGWIDLGPEHHQPWGLVHGGVYTTAIESAASVGASTANFLRSMTEGRVTVDARAVQQGRTQQLWEVRITDDRDRLIATGQVRLQNISPRA